MVSKIFQLPTDGIVFVGKVKSIGRSEQMDRNRVSEYGRASIVTLVVVVTSTHPPEAAMV